jgi:hypothetical protein
LEKLQKPTEIKKNNIKKWDPIESEVYEAIGESLLQISPLVR